jgi:hypothetical protein
MLGLRHNHSQSGPRTRSGRAWCETSARGADVVNADHQDKLASGSTAPEVARDLGISEATFHRWRNRYGGMSSQEAKRLKEL